MFKKPEAMKHKRNIKIWNTIVRKLILFSVLVKELSEIALV